jgi:molybdopterin-guanine dinucleotide biosynthesis protein A
MPLLTAWNRRKDFGVADTEYTPHPAQPDVTAFILTGGKSERMGQDKALLRLPSGSTLLENALAVASSVAAEVGVVGPRQRYGTYAWAGEIVEDIFPDQGPLGGIHAALSVTKTEWNIFIAVDIPQVSPELLRWMLKEAHEGGRQVTIASVAGGLQPLCGIYRKSFKDRAEDSLNRGQNKVAASFDSASLRVLTEEEIRTAGFSPELFQNVNTPEDFKRVFVGEK